MTEMSFPKISVIFQSLKNCLLCLLCHNFATRIKQPEQMKNSPFLRTIFLLLLMVMSTTYSYADEGNSDCTIPMYEDTDSPLLPDVEPDGTRSLAGSVFVKLSMQYGVFIPGCDMSQAESYEVYDTKGALVASFVDGIEFCTFVLSSKGTLKLKINLTEFSLFGEISL